MRTAEEANQWSKEGVAPIPLAYRSKRPLVKWTTWEDRQPPDALIKSWFSMPNRNLGIVLKNNLVALDFDNAGSYFLWKREAPKALQESHTVRSGRGWHVYVRVKEPFNHIARIDRGGEVRGRGIMVVPPSLHASGKEYRKLNSSGIEEVQSVDELYVRYTLGMPGKNAGIGKTRSYSGDGVMSRILNGMRIDKYLNRFSTVEWNGTAWFCRCPFHNDNNPSMQVNIEEGYAYCHAPHCIAHRKCTVITIAEMIWQRPLNEVLFLLMSELE